MPHHFIIWRKDIVIQPKIFLAKEKLSPLFIVGKIGFGSQSDEGAMSGGIITKMLHT